MDSRGKRVVKAPVPLYVPDEDVMDDSEVESDFDIDDEDDEGLSIASEEGDESEPGKDDNYEFDDFVVPDDASLGQEPDDDTDEESEWEDSEEEDD